LGFPILKVVPMLDAVMRVLILAGVPTALFAGLFAIWQTLVNHRNALRQQRERYRYDLAREIDSEVAGGVHAASRALVEAGAFWASVTNNLESVAIRWQKIAEFLQHHNAPHQAVMAIFPTKERGDIGATFINLHSAAAQAIASVLFILVKYKVAVPQAAGLTDTIAAQWQDIFLRSEPVHNFILAAIKSETDEHNDTKSALADPGILYVEACLKLGMSLENLLLKAESELVGELFDAVSHKRPFWRKWKETRESWPAHSTTACVVSADATAT
jgi:hypothetical protein